MATGSRFRCRYVRWTSLVDQRGQRRSLLDRRQWGAAAVLALAMVTGCSGDDGEESPYEHGFSTLDDLPACADVWVEGNDVPDDYQGCLEEGGHANVSGSFECSDEELVSYDDRFYGITGGEVHAVEGEMASDPAYRALFEECQSNS